MLLLWDIDSTLTETSGSGMKSLRDAGRDLFGQSFTIEGVAFSGRLDPLIIADLLRVNGQDDSSAHHAAMQAGYAKYLQRYLADPTSSRALPGVLPLLDAVRRDAQFTSALLTGNFEQTGTMKLHACGIDPARFAFGVWGNEATGTPPRREQLVPIALNRLPECTGRRVTPAQAVVIGDTPHDVSAARENGLRCLAVATGKFSIRDLEDAGAHKAVPTLEDTDTILAWLLQR